jgi:hypothetical protein
LISLQIKKINFISKRKKPSFKEMLPESIFPIASAPERLISVGELCRQQDHGNETETAIRKILLPNTGYV